MAAGDETKPRGVAANMSQQDDTITVNPTEPVGLQEMQDQLWWSGTDIFGGMISDDYNPELSGREAIQKYEEMRRSDASVAAVLLACSLPIRSTERYIEPGKDEDGQPNELDTEVQEFVKKALFEKMESTRDHFLEECTTFFAFWYSLFEKVYTVDDNNVWIKKLWYRHPRTIWLWQTTDQQPWVQQQLLQPAMRGINKMQTTVNIPAAKLLRFTINQLWDNYEGISLLRPAYKHWYIKSQLEKFDAIKHQKQGVGIPKINIPSMASADDKRAALDIVENFKGNEQSGIVLPWSEADWRKAEFMDLKAWDTTNMQASIDYHNRQIFLCAMAQWMELGNTQSGSFSLGQDQSSFFLMSMESYAKLICDTINRYLIPELVGYNFNVERFPQLRFKTLTKQSFEKTATIISTLIGSGALVADDKLESYLRDMADLPPADVDTARGDTATAPVDPTAPTAPDDGMGDATDSVDQVDTSALDDTSEIDGLDAELNNLGEFAEMQDEYVQAFADYIDTAESDLDMCFAVSSATSSKISEALTKYWASRKKSPDAAKETADKWAKIVEEAQKKIDAKVAEIKGKVDATKKAVSALRDQIASLTAGGAKLSKEQKAELRTKRDAIRWQIKGIRDEAKAAVDWLRSDLQSARDTKAGAKVVVSQSKKEVSRITKEEKKAAREAKKKGRAKKFAEFESWYKILDTHSYTHTHTVVDGDVGNCLEDKEFMELCNLFDNDMILRLQAEVAPEFAQDVKKKSLKYNEYEYEAFRPLTFAERKVNFSAIKRSMDKVGGKLSGAAAKTFAKIKNDLVDQIDTAIRVNDVDMIANIKAKYLDELSQHLTDAQKDVFEVGKQTAASEMSVAVPPTKTELKGALRGQNDMIIKRIWDDMESVAKTAAYTIVNRNAGDIVATGPTRVNQAVTESLNSYIPKADGALNSLGLTMAINLWRATIFERYPEQVYAMQYSAIIDERTTDRCLSLDGRVVKAWSAAFYEYSPPQHYNCRSIRVEILDDEVFKPDITGIPDSIDPVLSIDNVPEMTKPVVAKNSPAIKMIQQEIEDRKAKNKEYEDSKTYPNRVKQNTDRINVLEKAIKWKFYEIAKSLLMADGIQFRE